LSGSAAPGAGGSAHGGSAREKYSPAVKAAFVKFAQCMRSKGISMPEPNTSGPGPLFDPKQIDASPANFQKALSTCRAQLLASIKSG
jgi:hypothetical protein